MGGGDGEMKGESRKNRKWEDREEGNGKEVKRGRGGEK